MDFGSLFGSAVHAAAGAIPGGSDVFDALSTPDGRRQALSNVFDALKQQANGALAGAAAGARTVQVSQTTASAVASQQGQTGIWLGLAFGAAALGVVLLRRR